MHRGDWDNGMGGGSWWFMAIMMIALWGGAIWIAVTLIRHRDHTAHLQTPGMQPPLPQPMARAVARLMPQEILAERLARGEIEPDDYRQRLDALRHNPEN